MTHHKSKPQNVTTDQNNLQQGAMPLKNEPKLVEIASNRAPIPLENASIRAPMPVDNASNRALIPLENASNRALMPLENASNRAPMPLENAFNRALMPVENASNCFRAVIRIPAKLKGIIIGDRGEKIHEIKMTSKCYIIKIDTSGLCEFIGSSESVQKAQECINEIALFTRELIRTKLEMFLYQSNIDDELHDNIIDYIMNEGVEAAFDVMNWLPEEFWGKTFDDELFGRNCGKTELEKVLDRWTRFFDRINVDDKNFLRERLLLSLIKNKMAKESLNEFKHEIEYSKIQLLEEKLNENEFKLD